MMILVAVVVVVVVVLMRVLMRICRPCLGEVRHHAGCEGRAGAGHDVVGRRCGRLGGHLSRALALLLLHLALRLLQLGHARLARHGPASRARAAAATGTAARRTAPGGAASAPAAAAAPGWAVGPVCTICQR